MGHGRMRTRLSFGRSDSATYTDSTMRVPNYPRHNALRHVRPWMQRPVFSDVRRQAAVHEAGHIVFMRWLGMPSPGATITTNEAGATGEALWPDREFFAGLPDPQADESGTLAATAAGLFHAGVVAEAIAAGVELVGPIHYQGTDYAQADEMLSERFGHHASGAHFYAQRVALHALASMWGDVELIAGALMQSGHWKPN